MPSHPCRQDLRKLGKQQVVSSGSNPQRTCANPGEGCRPCGQHPDPTFRPPGFSISLGLGVLPAQVWTSWWGREQGPPLRGLRKGCSRIRRSLQAVCEPSSLAWDGERRRRKTEPKDPSRSTSCGLAPSPGTGPPHAERRQT